MFNPHVCMSYFENIPVHRPKAFCHCLPRPRVVKTRKAMLTLTTKKISILSGAAAWWGVLAHPKYQEYSRVILSGKWKTHHISKILHFSGKIMLNPIK